MLQTLFEARQEEKAADARKKKAEEFRVSIHHEIDILVCDLRAREGTMFPMVVPIESDGQKVAVIQGFGGSFDIEFTAIHSFKAPSQSDPDDAAIFSAATSLLNEITTIGLLHQLTSEGHDEKQRIIHKLAARFEKWACAHVDFERMDKAWPYWLHANFGPMIVKYFNINTLDSIGERDFEEFACTVDLPCIGVKQQHPLP